MMKFYLLGLILLFSLGLPAQSLYRLSGRVMSAQDSSGIAFASISVKGKPLGTYADEAGNFILELYAVPAKGDSLMISSLGFTTGRIALKDIPEKLNVYLQPVFVEVKETTVGAFTAEEVLSRCVQKIPENFPGHPFLLEGFYRQYHRENSTYVRLIEAVVHIFDPGYRELEKAGMQELIRVEALRRSHNYEKNGEQHGDHLVDLLLKNPVKYPTGSLLNLNGLKQYQLQFIKPLAFGDSVYAIRFDKQPRDNKERIEKGVIYISKAKLAILQVELEEVRNTAFIERWERSAGDYDWHFQEGTSLICFQQIGNKLYPQRLVMTYRHHLIHETFRSVDYVVDEHFELQVLGVQDSILAGVPDRNYHDYSSLYSGSRPYEPGYWKAFSRFPPDPAVLRDLHQRHPLEKQFRENAE